MDSRDKLRLFASQVASVAQGLALVRDPRFDERRSRLVDGALSIDLLNMLHVVSWQTVEEELRRSPTCSARARCPAFRSTSAPTVPRR